MHSGELGDNIEIGMQTVKFGTSSITVRCEVRTKFSKKTIVTIEKIVFVHVDENGRPKAHGITKLWNRPAAMNVNYSTRIMWFPFRESF